MSDKWHIKALALFEEKNNGEKPKDGTYELCGPKINGNREGLEELILIKHDSEPLDFEISRESCTFENIKKFLEENNIEGIVFHHMSDESKKCKIRREDFGIKWEGKNDRE